MFILKIVMGEKMNIKTITCHDVYNVGASLQAYALATYLKKLGNNVEIINYKPDYLSNHFSLLGVNNPRFDHPILRQMYQIAKFPERIKKRFGRRKKAFDIFTAQYLPLTDKCYTSNAQLQDDLPEADVYFAGSDQIWNPLFRNGKDSAFYLDFVPEEKIKASYAASFAVKSLPDEYKKQIKQWLSRLDYISVREKSGVDIINGLGIVGAKQVLDPVFLLDKSEWKKLEKSVDIKQPYILVYDFDSDINIQTYVKNLSKVNNWKIYSVLQCKYCDKSFEDYGPQTFLYLVHHAEVVVSNSFHATAFAIIFNKQFYVFGREENINSRMQDLLIEFGLENRYANLAPNMTINSFINYYSIQPQIDRNIMYSKMFIQKVLYTLK